MSPGETIWQNWPDDRLLDLRFCDLELDLQQPAISRLSLRLQREVGAAGLQHLKPRIYFGDEWFSPDRTVAISIPFYLGHPRLARLEKAILGEIEGETPIQCMRLLRHEAGHCFEHAYALSELPAWQRAFGDPNQPYEPDAYQTSQSLDFVRHLPNGYAQAHPHEDFAETFAVWLAHPSTCAVRYQNQPNVLRKLELVARLAKKYGKCLPIRPDGPPLSPVKGLRRTLGKHYQQRLRILGPRHFAYFDVELRKLFRHAPHRTQGAAALLAAYRDDIVSGAVASTGYRPRVVRQQFNRMLQRIAQLDLQAPKASIGSVVEFSAWFAARITAPDLRMAQRLERNESKSIRYSPSVR